MRRRNSCGAVFRCFAGGLRPRKCLRVTGFRMMFAILDLRDALVRKSLLVAEMSSGRTRFSMLETIRPFALRTQLVACCEANPNSGRSGPRPLALLLRRTQ